MHFLDEIEHDATLFEALAERSHVKAQALHLDDEGEDEALQLVV